MNWDERLAIREAYKDFKTDIGHDFRRCPYSLGIDWKFTPIEFNVWGSIRYLGLPLYPQFPIGPFFVDFGDPVKKIAIEVDSIRWHRDKEKDLKREIKIRKMGWNVYRIISWMTFNERCDYEDDDGNIDNTNWNKFLNESAEGYLMKIYTDYGWWDSRRRWK